MNKWLKDNIVNSLTLTAIVGAAVYFGVVQGLWFTSPEIRVRTEDHVTNAKTERELFETLDILDEAAEFTKKDSEENLKRDQERDTLVKRMAVTVYQLKSELDRKNTQDSIFLLGVQKHLDEHDQ
jgi:hypothetical protein